MSISVGTYTYVEVSADDANVFGQQLTKALTDQRRAGCEIVSVSMSTTTVKLEPDKQGDGLRRVAQVLIFDPQGVRAMDAPTDGPMH